jgi:hypothetical protein
MTKRCASGRGIQRRVGKIGHATWGNARVYTPAETVGISSTGAWWSETVPRPKARGKTPEIPYLGRVPLKPLGAGKVAQGSFCLERAGPGSHAPRSGRLGFVRQSLQESGSVRGRCDNRDSTYLIIYNRAGGNASLIAQVYRGKTAGWGTADVRDTNEALVVTFHLTMALPRFLLI